MIGLVTATPVSEFIHIQPTLGDLPFKIIHVRLKFGQKTNCEAKLVTGWIMPQYSDANMVENPRAGNAGRCRIPRNPQMPQMLPTSKIQPTG